MIGEIRPSVQHTLCDIFLRSLVGLKGCSVAGGVMASETELFYLVLLTLLTLIIHLIHSMKHRRDDKHSHV
jgi:hypothetical protein